MTSIRATLCIVDEAIGSDGDVIRKNDGLLSSRLNSFFRRSTMRAIPEITGSSTANSDKCDDFLNLVTAVDDLYSQPNVLKMQQINNATKRDVGAGAMFQVSYIGTENTKLSDVVADNIIRQTQPIILKKSPIKMFGINGEPFESSASRQAAASFIMELRILSQPYVRSHANIVDLLGIGWEYSNSPEMCPEPSLVLEQAYGTLVDFQTSNPNLPFHTRVDICLDVAKGLQALHDCGIVHGDVKLENVLMFEKSRWTAKIADFSHSLLNTAEEQYLVGGTAVYAAPEWKQKLSPAGLTKTDVYSLGFVIVSIIIGFDVGERFLNQLENGRTPGERFQNLTLLKNTDQWKGYIIGMMEGIDDTDLASRRDDLPLFENLIDLTLRVDPSKRDLSKLIQRMPNYKAKERQDSPAKVMERLNSNILSIPYNAMSSMSFLLKAQVVRSLECLASKADDERSAAAYYELAVCYFSGFGVDVNYSAVVDWLVKGGERGETWARATISRICDAVGLRVPATTPVDDWLVDAARGGSRIALESLLENHSPRCPMAVETFHSEFINAALWELNNEKTWSYHMAHASDIIYFTQSINSNKDTIIHLAAVRGSIEAFSSMPESIAKDSSVLNLRNFDGDTPLICACKAGRYEIIRILLERGADATISNNNCENCLHFLAFFDDEQVESIAETLMQSGADSTQEAKNATTSRPFEVRPIVPGCPLVRATTLNKHYVLEVLLRLQKKHQGQLSRGQIKIHKANYRKLIAWACRLSAVDILNVLFEHSPEIFDRKSINSIGFWSEGRRYSLAALAILGCVSNSPASGFNLPERFWRVLSYGREHCEKLYGTLAFLIKVGVDFVRTKCGGERNAIFLAIKEGKIDALKFLLQVPDIGLPYHVFNVRGDGPSSRTLVGPPHRLKVGLVEAIKLAILQGNRDVFRMLLRLHNGEALHRGPCFPVFIRRTTRDPPSSKDSRKDRPRRLQLRRYNDTSESEDEDENEFNSQESHQSGTLSVKAVLKNNNAHCFYPETAEMDIRTICFRCSLDSVSRPIWFIKWPSVTNLIPRISVHGRRFDGRINYGLLYMTFITMADHRDIEFSKILIRELKKYGIDNYEGWVANDFEQMCYPELLEPPLYRSAVIQWNELSEFLLTHDADPRKTCYWEMYRGRHSRSKFSVIIKLLEHGDLKTVRMLAEVFQRSPHKSLPLLFRTTEVHELMNLESDDFDAVAEASELWSLCLSHYQTTRQSVSDSPFGLILLAAAKQSPIAMDHLLQMGLKPNGKSLISFFVTPLDVVAPIKTSAGQACQRVLLKHGGQRGGILCLAEMHLLANVFLLALIAVSIWGTSKLGSLGDEWFYTLAVLFSGFLQPGRSPFIIGIGFFLGVLLCYLPTLILAFILFIRIASFIQECAVRPRYLLLGILSPVSFMALIRIFDDDAKSLSSSLRGPLWYIFRPIFNWLFVHEEQSADMELVQQGDEQSPRDI